MHRTVFIFIMALFVWSACTHLPTVDTPIDYVYLPTHEFGVYLAPADDLPLPFSEFERFGLTILQNQAELDDYLAQKTASVIYLHRDAAEHFDMTWVDLQHLVHHVPIVTVDTIFGFPNWDRLSPDLLARPDYVYLTSTIKHEAGGTSWYGDFMPVERWEDIPYWTETVANRSAEEAGWQVQGYKR